MKPALLLAVSWRLGDVGGDWQQTELPSGALARFSEESVVWYRADVEATADDQVALDVVGHWQLYADGELVASGRPGPAAVPLADATDRLELRTWIDRRWTLQGGPSLRRFEVDPRAGQWLAERRHADLVGALPDLAVAAASLVLGLLHVGLHRRRPQMRGNLVFGAAALVNAATGAVPSLVATGAIPLFFGYRTVFLLLIAALYPLMMAALSDLFGGSRRLVAALAVLFALRSVAMLVFPVWTSDHFTLHTLAVALPSFAMVGWLVARGWTQNLPGSRVIAFGAVVFQVGPLTALLGPWLPAPPLAIAAAIANVVWLSAMAWAFWVERLIASADELGDAYRASLLFVPSEFLRRIGRASFREVKRGDAVQTRMTVLFLDIRDFTAIAEKNPPEVVFGLVNAVLDQVQPLVTANGGFIASNTGDGFAAVFQSAEGAVDAAARMQHRLDAAGKLPFPIRAGIGIHTGTLQLGTIGGPTYLTVGTVGDAVNLAARIEGLTKVYGARVLVSASSASELPSMEGLRPIDRVVVKGRSEPIDVFQVLAAERVRPEPEPYGSAHAAYVAGSFQRALDLLAEEAADPPAAALAARCRHLLAHPPASWDGVWRHEQK